MILDDDHSGVFGFQDVAQEVSESVGEYRLKVARYSGARGRIIILQDSGRECQARQGLQARGRDSGFRKQRKCNRTFKKVPLNPTKDLEGRLSVPAGKVYDMLPIGSNDSLWVRFKLHSIGK
ncbi:hypothetical protein CEXT_654711 [Caerostris extrusa]|uniref:Uncharacterized protein n=1 Tax=Caerostris extrusa TaxID=172846 RepID=A0AAV4V9F2_CAEEX|nr:hypothetical protein CEXT_654711 [Caerostris extrusa]